MSKRYKRNSSVARLPDPVLEEERRKNMRALNELRSLDEWAKKIRKEKRDKERERWMNDDANVGQLKNDGEEPKVDTGAEIMKLFRKSDINLVGINRKILGDYAMNRMNDYFAFGRCGIVNLSKFVCNSGIRMNRTADAYEILRMKPVIEMPMKEIGESKEMLAIRCFDRMEDNEGRFLGCWGADEGDPNKRPIIGNCDSCYAIGLMWQPCRSCLRGTIHCMRHPTYDDWPTSELWSKRDKKIWNFGEEGRAINPWYIWRSLYDYNDWCQNQDLINVNYRKYDEDKEYIQKVSRKKTLGRDKVLDHDHFIWQVAYRGRLSPFEDALYNALNCADPMGLEKTINRFEKRGYEERLKQNRIRNGDEHLNEIYALRRLMPEVQQFEFKEVPTFIHNAEREVDDDGKYDFRLFDIGEPGDREE